MQHRMVSLGRLELAKTCLASSREHNKLNSATCVLAACMYMARTVNGDAMACALPDALYLSVCCGVEPRLTMRVDVHVCVSWSCAVTSTLIRRSMYPFGSHALGVPGAT